MRIEKDFRDFLKLLNAKSVKYLIVGGFAYSYYAEPRYTKDIYIFVERTKENAEQIISAIADFWGEESELKVDDLLEKDKIIQLGYDPIRIDIITSIEGVEFAQSWKNRVKATYGDIEVFFISLDDLINNKRATGRERDTLDAKYLRRIKSSRGK